MVSCRDALSSDSPKIEGIEKNRLPRAGKIRRNPDDHIGQLVCLRHCGFDRVTVLAIGLVRKWAVDGQRLRIFWIFLTFLTLTVRISLSKHTGHTQKKKSKRIFSYLVCLTSHQIMESFQSQ